MITIIVMLILVVVTVNLANENGGLLVTTRRAKTETQVETDRENLLLAVMGGFKEGGEFDIAQVKLEDMKWCKKGDKKYLDTESTTPQTGDGCWIITKANSKFYVDKDGNILDDEPTPEIFKAGALVLNGATITFNETITEPNITENFADIDQKSITMNNENGDEIEIYFYGDKNNKVAICIDYYNGNASPEIDEEYMYLFEDGYVFDPEYDGTINYTEPGWYKKGEEKVWPRITKEQYPKITGLKVDSNANNIALANKYFKDVIIVQQTEDTDLQELRAEFIGKEFNSVYIDNGPGQLSSNGFLLAYVEGVEGEGENVGVFSYKEKSYKFRYNEETRLIDLIERYQ